MSRDAAEDAAMRALLSCHAREAHEAWHYEPAGEGHVGILPLPALDADLVVWIAHLSPTLRHRHTLPARLAVPGRRPHDVSLPLLASLLADQLGGGDPSGLVGRVLESAGAQETYLSRRAADVDRLWGPAPLGFIDSEQALLLGHMIHPTPKSRGEMGIDGRVAYAPESAARFPLHWLAVDPPLVAHASAEDTPAPALAEALLRGDPALDHGALERSLAGLGPRTLIPAHPWEAAHLGDDPDAAALIDAGRVVDLGPLGGPVTPTTSVRTVYRGDWPWQLKFSLHVSVTNSVRVTLPKELDRAVEAARLARTAVGAEAARVAPRFVILQDPAYLAVRHEGRVLSPFSVLLRDNRWPAGDGVDVSAVTTLCQDHPRGGRSRLGAIVAEIARRDGRPEHEVGREWFARYCDAVVVSLLRLYLDLGLCFEPHQQNTLLELEGGWPVRCVCRDSQGYFHRALAHADLCRHIPGLGEASESIFPEALADERLVYYPFVNNALGVVSALGLAGCADEDELLADLRRVIEAERARGGRYPATLLDRLLDDAQWPCKGNLRTRLHDMDELVGDISEQSIYVRIPNPLRPVAA